MVSYNITIKSWRDFWEKIYVDTDARIMFKNEDQMKSVHLSHENLVKHIEEIATHFRSWQIDKINNYGSMLTIETPFASYGLDLPYANMFLENSLLV